MSGVSGKGRKGLRQGQALCLVSGEERTGGLRRRQFSGIGLISRGFVVQASPGAGLVFGVEAERT